MRYLVLVTLVFALALASLGGCATKDGDRSGPGASDQTSDSVEPTGQAGIGFSFLDGTWRVSTDLVTIDNPGMTPAADRPGATWSCVVDDTVMTLLTDQHEYTGALSSAPDGGWRYDATAQYVDEDGATWTSTIGVQAHMTGDDSFAGTMEGTIESGAEGHLYTATWDITGTRQ